jgi:hypothetical protein
MRSAWRNWAVRFAVCCLFPLHVPAARARATDLIDTAALGQRGVVFETRTLGYSALSLITGVGDFNGDGFDDLATFSREVNEVDFLESLVFGRADLSGRHSLGDPSLPALNLRYQDIRANRGGGGPVRPAGDLDGDGFSDAFICIPEYRLPDRPPGRVCLLRGSASLSGDHLVEEIGNGIPGVIFESLDPIHQPGLDAVNIGDFSGDGDPDIAILGFELASSRSALFLTFGAHDLPPRVDLGEVGASLHSVLYGPRGFAGMSIARAGDEAKSRTPLSSTSPTAPRRPTRRLRDGSSSGAPTSRSTGSSWKERMPRWPSSSSRPNCPT